jgi:hypothetical protein
MTVVRRLSRPFGELSRRIRATHEGASERIEHDLAMRDPGVAADHAHSISRAVSRGEPGCSYCS